MVGETISHYKVLSELGRGGMGVVYKAEDTKLERTVALKFLASHLLEDEEGHARFIREAKAAASLDHPNICTVFEIDEVEGETFIAMACLEGQTVKAKIAERPLKLDEALDIAIQTAQGLQAAHEKEIVHRDIKPANLMVTPQGQVKIMDFGLAQLAEGSKLTKTATILGTPAYMSPEQSQRLPTDRRTDIWSLGVVVYEMVTGRTPFEGERQEAVLYAIGSEEPEPITALRAGVPMELERIVGKALAKDKEERYQHIEEMLVDLRGLTKKLASGKSTIGVQSGVASQQTAVVEPTIGPLARYRVIEDVKEAEGSIKYLAEDTELHRSVAIRVLPQSSEQQIERAQRRKQAVLLGTAVLGVFFGLVFAFLWLSSTDTVAERPLRRFALPVEGPRLQVAISPDGRHIAYTTRPSSASELWIWDLDRLTPRKIETASAAVYPFWSPNSDFVGFGAVGSELKKVSVHGGPASTICAIQAGYRGGSWSPDGSSIVFSSSGGDGFGLYEVPAQGGTAKPLFEPEESEQQLDQVLPHFLPHQGGSRGLLFAKGATATNLEIVVLDLESGRQDVLAPGSRPVYSPTGHIVYESENTLWALPYSAETLRATGEPFPVSGSGSVASVSRDGTLVYLHSDETGLRQLIWRDRKGQKLGTIGAPQPQMSMPVLSPDGNQVVVQARDNDNTDIWVHEVARGLKRRLTFDPANDARPTWTPRGDKISFSSDRDGNMDVFTKLADGSGEAERLLATPANEWGYEWSADGKYLVGSGEGKLWYMRAEESASTFEKVMFFDTPFDAVSPNLAPDAKFLAYESNESGRYEVYVQPFPQGGAKWQVSTNGGGQPRWHGDGKEIFYVEGDTLMAVSVTTSPAFSVGAAQPLFEDRAVLGGRGQLYDVTPDGQRFVVVETLGDADTGQAIHVVENWYEEFREREQEYGMHP